MSQVAFITADERQIYLEYDRERRLRLTRVIAPIFAILFSFILIAAFTFLQGELTHTRQYWPVLLACAAFFGVGWAAARRRQVNLATGSTILGTLMILVLFVLVNSPLYLSQLLTIPAAVIIGVAALLGLPWMIFAVTALISVFVLFLSQDPVNTALLAQFATSSVHAISDEHNQNFVSVYALLIEQWVLAALMFALARGYRRTLRETGDVRVQYERARKLDELKDQFISNVNHELRNPVMLMQGYIELLMIKGDEVDAEMRTLLMQNANEAGDNLVELIESILDARRLDQGAEDFTPESVSVLAAIKTAASLVDPREGKLVERDLRIQVTAGLQIWGEKIRLQQILTNLISNACKYSPPGTPIDIRADVVSETTTGAGRLRHAAPSRPMAEITVRDYGLGIPPAEIPLLFHRFVRLERELASTVIGNGLGLYLCRALAEAMGGTIWVESSGREGDGSTFHLRLPLAPVLPPPTEQPTQKSLVNAASRTNHS
jgi:signal transduction histidine kinase